MPLGPIKLGNMFWGLWHLDMFLPVCWSEGGFNAALPSGWNTRQVLRRFWVLLQTLIFIFFFEGKLLTWFVLVIAVSVLHGCIVSLSILFPAQALQSHGGAHVAGQRLSEALVCWLHLPRATVCPEPTTEGKRQRAVNNLKCIWIFVFSGTPTLAERVQQQTGVLPWPGLCLLFPIESNNELWACAFLPVSCLQTESREVARLYQAAHAHLQCIEPLWPNAKIFLFLSFSLFHYICRKSCCSTVPWNTSLWRAGGEAVLFWPFLPPDQICLH